MNWLRGPCFCISLSIWLLLTYCYVSLRPFTNSPAQPLLYNSAIGTDGRNTSNWMNIIRREICWVCYASDLWMVHGAVSDFPTPRVRNPDFPCSGLLVIRLVNIIVDVIYRYLCFSLFFVCVLQDICCFTVFGFAISPLPYPYNSNISVLLIALHQLPQ